MIIFKVFFLYFNAVFLRHDIGSPRFAPDTIWETLGQIAVRHLWSHPSSLPVVLRTPSPWVKVSPIGVCDAMLREIGLCVRHFALSALHPAYLAYSDLPGINLCRFNEYRWKEPFFLHLSTAENICDSQAIENWY